MSVTLFSNFFDKKKNRANAPPFRANLRANLSMTLYPASGELESGNKTWSGQPCKT